MSNLVNAFDFENVSLYSPQILTEPNLTTTSPQPDFSVPDLPVPNTPIKDGSGNIIGLYSGLCAKEWTGSCSGSQYVSGIPYGEQTEEDALFFEDGFKGVRGNLTEGRYLVFEANGYAISNPGSTDKQFTTATSTANHDDIKQRWVLHAVAEEGTLFRISSALDGMYISQHSSLSKSVSGAEIYNIVYIGSSQYTLQKENGAYLNIESDGSLSFTSHPVAYNIYSVTYHS